MTTPAERQREIGITIREAMSKLSDIDWTRENESIISAQAELNEVTALYCEGKVSQAEVKRSYKAFVNAHRGGLF